MTHASLLRARPVRIIAGLILASYYVMGLSAGAFAGPNGDRDGDGMPNRWETSNGLRVTQNDAARDADRDSLSNLREYRLRTNPRSADTDGDGAEDGAERRAGTNPRRRDGGEGGASGSEAAGAEGEARAAQDGTRRDCPKDGESGEQPQPQPQPQS